MTPPMPGIPSPDSVLAGNSPGSSTPGGNAQPAISPIDAAKQNGGAVVSGTFQISLCGITVRFDTAIALDFQGGGPPHVRGQVSLPSTTDAGDGTTALSNVSINFDSAPGDGNVVTMTGSLTMPDPVNLGNSFNFTDPNGYMYSFLVRVSLDAGATASFWFTLDSSNNPHASIQLSGTWQNASFTSGYQETYPRRTNPAGVIGDVEKNCVDALKGQIAQELFNRLKSGNDIAHQIHDAAGQLVNDAGQAIDETGKVIGQAEDTGKKVWNALTGG